MAAAPLRARPADVLAPRRRGRRGSRADARHPGEVSVELFGAEASEPIIRLLARKGIGIFTGSFPTAYRGGELSLSPAGRLVVERVVTIPRIEGPGIEGLPSGPHGFIPVDYYGRVKGLEDVYAAGDATTVPIKQGGLAAQMGEVVAGQIAVAAGADVEVGPFRPVLRGMLLTGDTPRTFGPSSPRVPLSGR